MAQSNGQRMDKIRRTDDIKTARQTIVTQFSKFTDFFNYLSIEIWNVHLLHPLLLLSELELILRSLGKMIATTLHSFTPHCPMMHHVRSQSKQHFLNISSLNQVIPTADMLAALVGCGIKTTSTAQLILQDQLNHELGRRMGISISSSTYTWQSNFINIVSPAPGIRVPPAVTLHEVIVIEKGSSIKGLSVGGVGGFGVFLAPTDHEWTILKLIKIHKTTHFAKKKLNPEESFVIRIQHVHFLLYIFTNSHLNM